MSNSQEMSENLFFFPLCYLYSILLIKFLIALLWQVQIAAAQAIFIPCTKPVGGWHYTGSSLLFQLAWTLKLSQCSTKTTAEKNPSTNIIALILSLSTELWGQRWFTWRRPPRKAVHLLNMVYGTATGSGRELQEQNRCAVEGNHESGSLNFNAFHVQTFSFQLLRLSQNNRLRINLWICSEHLSVHSVAFIISLTINPH